MISGRSNMPSNDEGTSSSNDNGKDPQLKKFLFKCDQTNQQLEVFIPEVRFRFFIDLYLENVYLLVTSIWLLVLHMALCADPRLVLVGATAFVGR